MSIQKAIQNVFSQLSDSLQKLSHDEYTQPSDILFNATIGQHVRHIIELFIELDKGYKTGCVNYEKRKRDYTIETDKDVAIDLLHKIYLQLHKPDKDLLLEANFSEDANETVIIPTNYFREVMYNLEHTVHHMALIRVGINEVSSLLVPKDYGVASSTIKYKKACAQ
ncbi:MAG: hypothetical protein ABIN97_11220 [Ginsengibacter sp.]